MHEVSALAARAALEMCARAEFSVDEIVSGLPFDARSLKRLRRVAWHDYATICERMELACGSPEALQDLLEATYHNSWPPEARTFLRAFVTPKRLASFVILRMDPSIFRCVDFSFVDLGRDRARVGMRLREGARPCRAWFSGSVGALRGIPNYLGLPPARADVEVLGDTEMVVNTRFPPAGALPERSAAAVRSVAQFFARTLVRDAREHSERVTDILALGRELARHRDLPSLAETLVQMLGKLGWRRVALHVVPIGGSAPVPRASHGAGEAVRAFDLVAADRLVGRLEVGGAGDAALLEELVPWVSIAVDNARTFAAASSRAAGDGRLETARRALDLTDRQCDVLARVVRGMTNKEIAAELRCAENTVEHHVTQLFRRMKVTSRTQLIAAFFEGQFGVSPNG